MTSEDSEDLSCASYLKSVDISMSTCSSEFHSDKQIKL
jgi:hypothetical protein